MTNKQYKQICQRSNVLSRFIIEETARLLPTYRDKLNEILSNSPIEKPPLHHGPANADHFRVPFSAHEAREIAEQLLDLEAEANEIHVAFIANFVDVWSNLANFD